MERLLAAKEHEKNEMSIAATARDPIEKYTKFTQSDLDKCKIYYSHPMAALEHIDVAQVGKWETFPDGKLLAHPFGLDVKTLTNHLGIKIKLFEAVGEITQSNTIGVNAPKPLDHEHGTPIVFLIYNISEIHRQILLDRQVWSSPEITFRVTTLDPVRPDYLFCIKDLTTGCAKEVEMIVRKVWDNSDTSDFVKTICETAPENQRLLITANISEFINSMWIKKLETKGPDKVDAPTFNVLAKGNYINDNGTWRLLKNFLVKQEYAQDFQDPGNAGTDFQRCTICYSVDHPRGLCCFPKTKGWHGPTWRIPPNLNRNNSYTTTHPTKQRRGGGGNWTSQRKK